MSDLIDGLNHPIARWTFANSTERAAAGNYFEQDIGKLGYQRDNGCYYQLTDVGTTPTWVLVAGASGANLPNTAVYSPTGTTNTSYFMVGLGDAAGGSAVITPVRTGNIFVNINGGMYNTTANDGVTARMAYGTGTPPIHHGAAAGTIVGSTQEHTVLNANEIGALSLSAVITGLTLGTQYWLDLQYAAATGGTAAVRFVTVCAFEF
jgi:hypothetical protein